MDRTASSRPSFMWPNGGDSASEQSEFYLQVNLPRFCRSTQLPKSFAHFPCGNQHSALQVMITTTTILFGSISIGIKWINSLESWRQKMQQILSRFPRTEKSAALSFTPEQSCPLTCIYKPQIGSETISPIGIQCLIILVTLTPSLMSSFLDYLTTPIVLVFVQWIDLLQFQLHNLITFLYWDQAWLAAKYPISCFCSQHACHGMLRALLAPGKRITASWCLQFIKDPFKIAFPSL